MCIRDRHRHDLTDRLGHPARPCLGRYWHDDGTDVRSVGVDTDRLGHPARPCLGRYWHDDGTDVRSVGVDTVGGESASGGRGVEPAGGQAVGGTGAVGGGGDGKGIVMRPGHLRPGTAKLAAKAAAKLSTRLSPGEKHGRKRMAELVAVYDLDPEPRTSRVGKQARRPGPVVTGKWLAASVTDDIPAVITRMFDEAERRDPNHERTWVALVDGNRQQIDTIRDQAATRVITVTTIIDFVHVIEYVWKAAWTFFYPGDPDAETWVAGVEEGPGGLPHVLDHVDEVDDGGHGDAPGGGLVTDGVDLLAVAVDQGDPGPLMVGVAPLGFVEHAGDDGRDVVGDAGGQPLAGHHRARPARLLAHP